MVAERLFRMDGTWLGHYDYPLPETRHRRMPPRVHFSMFLVEAADGTLAGEVHEDPPLGFPEVGMVGGRESERLVVCAGQRTGQEGSSPSGALMRGAISKSGGNASLAGVQEGMGEA